STTAAGVSRQYPPYYSPTKDDFRTINPGLTPTSVSYAWMSSGVSALPVIVDRYSDPLPILYFRRDQTSGAWCADNTSTPASYYRQENCEYFDGIVTSPSGNSFSQGRDSSYSAANPACAANLGASIMAVVGGGSASSRGDFLLISAGPDRIYGNRSGSFISDDLVHVTLR
ncbi:MAG TPA: hypothetical protein VHM90_08890, partial [Phycisphaerae bacterium]|nr:hypothetical protein [Phycisphaerae bacterium]